MEYDYIQRYYGSIFYPGDQVEHIETDKCGQVMRPLKSHLHYVRVNFGIDGAGLCHPSSLKIIARGKTWEAAQKTSETS